MSIVNCMWNICFLYIYLVVAVTFNKRVSNATNWTQKCITWPKFVNGRWLGELSNKLIITRQYRMMTCFANISYLIRQQKYLNRHPVLVIENAMELRSVIFTDVKWQESSWYLLTWMTKFFNFTVLVVCIVLLRFKPCVKKGDIFFVYLNEWLELPGDR